MQQFSLIVQQNASIAEELASSSEELTSQASMLFEKVSFFKTTSEELDEALDQELNFIQKRMNEIFELKKRKDFNTPANSQLSSKTQQKEEKDMHAAANASPGKEGLDLKLDEKDDSFDKF